MALFRKKTKYFKYSYERTKAYFEQHREIEARNFLKCPEWAKPEYCLLYTSVYPYYLKSLICSFSADRGFFLCIYLTIGYNGTNL